MADKAKSAAPDSSQQQQEEGGSWVSNLINKVIHPGSPQRDEASTSSEQQGEGWTGGIGAVIGGVVETAKEIINVTADAIATSAQDVKETFVGGTDEGSPSAKHERPTDESVHEPTEKRQRLPSKVKEKIASGVELTETSTERRSRAKQQWKNREQAAQPAPASKAIEESSDQPSGDAERGTNVDALLQQAEASDRRVIGRLTETNLAEYTKLPPEKYKETSKAIPSTYYPPQPTVSKQQKAHMRDPRTNAAYAPFQPGQAS